MGNDPGCGETAQPRRWANKNAWAITVTVRMTPTTTLVISARRAEPIVETSRRSTTRGEGAPTLRGGGAVVDTSLDVSQPFRQACPRPMAGGAHRCSLSARSDRSL